MDSAIEDFKNPPCQYRPVLQWSWNGVLSKERISEQLQQFAKQGIGGLLVHARPGHVTGYLSDEWFRYWEFAMNEAYRLGMEFHIYDEFLCPAGNAGGNVTAENPTVAARELKMVSITNGEKVKDSSVLAYILADANGNVIKCNADRDEATHAIVSPVTPRLIAGFPAPDLLRRQTTDTFIKCTHEKYAQRCGYGFGKQVKFMFCDEPPAFDSARWLPGSRFLFREFYKDHGYSIEDRIGSLCLNCEDSPSVRFDYWWTINRLFNQNFMIPMNEWCRKHNLLFTGHLVENRWPVPYSVPDTMASLRWMHAPGNDLLGIQFQPTSLRDNGVYFLNLKELSSIVNQLEPEWNLVETCGGRGYETSFAYFKSCEDFVLSFGVNVIDPHISHQTLSGIGKYDWPQTLSDHSPWWEYYRSHADHVARVNTALCQGKEYNRVLVLHPTTSAWMYYTGTAFDAHSGGTSAAKLKEIEQSQFDLLQTLYENQIDYDLGDEFIMEEFGKAEEGTCRIAKRTYDCIVIPPSMESWISSTFELMRSYLEQGGVVFSVSAIPPRINGRKSDEPVKLREQYEQQWKIVDTVETLTHELRAIRPTYISDREGNAVSGKLCWRRVVSEDGVWYFFANPWPEQIEMEIVLESGTVWQCDTADGSYRVFATEKIKEKSLVNLILPPRGHQLFFCSRKTTTESPAKDKKGDRVEIALSAIEPLEQNFMYIDYCDIEVNGRKRENISTALANRLNLHWQGYEESPFSRQFRRTAIDSEPDPDSSFSATYRFTVSPDISQDVMDTFSIAIERPWLFRITLNDIPLDSNEGTRWFDENMKTVPTEGTIRTGENTVRIKADPFSVLCNIMPIYVIGACDVVPADRGFVIHQRTRISLGDWTTQGLPFYHKTVRYILTFTLENTQKQLLVTLGRWEGAVTNIHVDGVQKGTIMHPPYNLKLTGPFEAGKHELTVDVIGNMRNMMGSHFLDGVQGVWSWEYSPDTMPPGERYKFKPSGLFGLPMLHTFENGKV